MLDKHQRMLNGVRRSQEAPSSKSQHRYILIVREATMAKIVAGSSVHARQVRGDGPTVKQSMQSANFQHSRRKKRAPAGIIVVVRPKLASPACCQGNSG